MYAHEQTLPMVDCIFTVSIFCLFQLQLIYTNIFSYIQKRVTSTCYHYLSMGIAVSVRIP